MTGLVKGWEYCNVLSHSLQISSQVTRLFVLAIRIMPKARTHTSRQHQVRPAAEPSRTRASPRASVRASTAASAGAARGAPADATPNATPVTDGESHTQITPQEALLSSQFMETLVNRVADEVFRRLAPAPTPPVLTSDLQEVPAGPLANHTAPTPVDALARNIVQGNLQKEAAAITGLPQQSSHTTAPHIPGQSCAFKHLCYRCEGLHVVTKCNFRDSAKLNHSQPQAAKSFLTQPSHPNKS